MITKPQQTVLGSIFFAGCLFLILCDMFRGFWDHDGGFYLVQSLAIARGFRPFIDYPSLYPPLFNLLNAIPMYLGIDHAILLWALPLFWIGVIGLLTALCWKKYSPQSSVLTRWLIGGGFALFCIDFGGNHLTLELGVIFFALLSLWQYDPQKNNSFFLIGCWVACAFLVKQMGVLLLLPFLTQLRTVQQGLLLWVGLMLPLLMCLAWLDFDVANLVANLALIKRYVNHTAPQGILFAMKQFFSVVMLTELRRSPPGMALFFVTYLMSGLVCVRLMKRRAIRECLWIAAWGVIGVIYFGMRAINNCPHYTLNCWASIVILLATATGLVELRIRQWIWISGLLFAVFFTFHHYHHVRDLQHNLYFSRWSHPNKLAAFIKPMSSDFNSLLPNDATITQLGMEEFVVFFLIDRLPINKGGFLYDIDAPIIGDAILLTDYGQSTALEKKKAIIKAGYYPFKIWQSSWGKIILFKQP